MNIFIYQNQIQSFKFAMIIKKITTSISFLYFLSNQQMEIKTSKIKKPIVQIPNKVFYLIDQHMRLNIIQKERKITESHDFYRLIPKTKLVLPLKYNITIQTNHATCCLALA